MSNVWLRQSTATTRPFGPFVEATDGYTHKATTFDLTTTVASNIILIERANATVTGLAGAFVLDHPGWANLAIVATDVAQLGYIKYSIGNASSNLPVWREYTVVPANIYDSIILGSDLLQVDVREVSGSAPTAAVFGANVIAINNAAPTTITFNANVLTITGGAVSDADINANMIAINNGAPTLITFNANVLTITGAAVSAIIFNANLLTVTGAAVSDADINANMIAINNAAPTTITFNANLLTVTGAAPSAAIPNYLLDHVLFTVGAQTLTVKNALKYMVAGVAGPLSGATTAGITLFGPSGNVLVSAAVASGNRTGVSYVT